jgi:methionyl-tRNA synthetase
MADKILVAVAWPYANGPLHVGHIAGVYLPADIFARYQRLRGNDVLMISGSDCHGTPIMLQAEREGAAPQEIIQRYHESFLNTFRTLGISFDLFTRTYTENHYAVAQTFFRRLLDTGYLYQERLTGSYSESLGRFLPDRFVEGTCSNCGFSRARGDQCDNCGRLQEPAELGHPHSTLDGAPVTFRETAHFMLDLPKIEPVLRAWLNSGDRSRWRPNTLLFTENWLKEGLHPRAITRDLDWGVPVPVEDHEFKEKRIYVWFDAVIGYYSASMEWASRIGQPDKWREWWENPGARSYYFIGKDNIPFHTIIWPAMLIAHGGLTLPYDVPANEFYNLEGEKMSTSRNWALWSSELENQYAPDAIRYYLAATAPEGRDTSWYWREFARRNNDELVATWGNLAQRLLSMAYRNSGRVPEPGAFHDADRVLLGQGRQAFETIGHLIDAVRLKAALQETMALAQRTNRYVSEQEPWRLVRTDRERAKTVIYTGLQLLDHLGTLFSPFLPFSCSQLYALLGYAEGLDRQWKAGVLNPGQPLRAPAPLFEKHP